MLRFVLGLVGALALLAVMHHGIMADKGTYGHEDAMTIAGTLFVATCALFFMLICRVHWVLGFAAFLALAAGDAARFGYVFTTKMDQLTALQSPIETAKKRHKAARQRLVDAKAALAAMPATTPRIDAARRAKAETERGVREKTSENGCRKGCTAQLAEQMASAKAELAAAYGALAARRAAAERRVSSVAAALAVIKPPASVSPTAKLIGWNAATLNAVLASLEAVALNLGAIVLLAVAGHSLRLPHPTPAAPPEAARDQIARFALDRYQPDASGQLLLAEAYSDYRKWCKTERARIVPVKDFIRELDMLARRANLQIAYDNDNQQVIIGMTPIKLIEAA